MQWHGGVGGAEVLNLELARAFRRLGVDSELVFLTSSGPMADRLVEEDIGFRVLGYDRGRDIVRRARSYSAAVTASGPDGALLPACGFIGGALRAGGFRAPIVAIEHGTRLQTRGGATKAVLRQANRIVGAWADDIEVGVSDFVVKSMRKGLHARRFGRIYNGVDPMRFQTVGLSRASRANSLVAGFAGRLIDGKGCEDVIVAVQKALGRVDVRLLVAGDGPRRKRLIALARSLGIADRVQFLGIVGDVRELWRRCDVAVFPSNQFVESFGMVALEAMACGRPVVAARNGAVPELVGDGETGIVLAPGDRVALAEALVTYAQLPQLVRSHGAQGRARVNARFHIDRCANAYLRCFGLVN